MPWPDRRVLVVIAHPDDETLGCGGTIAKASAAGADVTVLLALERVDPRGRLHWDDLLASFDAACSSLGARAVVAGPLLTEPQAEPEVGALHDAILPWVEEADVVLTHWPGDVNQAHRGVARAVEIASRPFRRHKEVLLFETPTSTDQAWVHAFSPNVYVVLEPGHCDAAVAAMEQYPVEHEIGRRPVDLRRRIEARGAEIGREHAEAFAMTRRYL